MPPERTQRGAEAADLLEKRALWIGLAVDFNLAFWATMMQTARGQASNTKNYNTWHGHSISASQLDYMLGELDDRVAWGCGQPAFRSGHGIVLSVYQKRPRRIFTGPRKPRTTHSLKGWSPEDDLELHKFRATTCRRLEALIEGDDCERIRPGDRIQEAEEVITTLAIQHGAIGNMGQGDNRGMSGRPICPRELRMLERQASDPSCEVQERRRLRTVARQVRRRWQLQLAQRKL